MFMLYYNSSGCSTRSHILNADSSPLRRNETNQTDKDLDFLRIGVLKRMSLLLNLNLKQQNTCLKKRIRSTLLTPSKY